MDRLETYLKGLERCKTDVQERLEYENLMLRIGRNPKTKKTYMQGLEHAAKLLEEAERHGAELSKDGFYVNVCRTSGFECRGHEADMTLRHSLKIFVTAAYSSELPPFGSGYQSYIHKRVWAPTKEKAMEIVSALGAIFKQELDMDSERILRCWFPN